MSPSMHSHVYICVVYMYMFSCWVKCDVDNGEPKCRVLPSSTIKYGTMNKRKDTCTNAEGVAVT